MIMVLNNATIQHAKIIVHAILAGIKEYAFTDVTQFLVEVTLMSNLLGIITTICLLIYIKVTCPFFVYRDVTRPRTFHSARYQIVPYIPKAKHTRSE